MPLPDKRLLSNWIDSYIEYTAEQESPESLHLWTGLTLISASIRRRIVLEMEYGKIYPNLYVIIVAESARVRKSTAMDLGRDLLMDALPDVRIMRDSMTSQGLIKSLNHKVQVIKDDKITEELRSDVAIFADEVANLFSYERTRAAQMVIFLTRAYGCPGVYDHTTVRDSTVRLHNLYPTLLGGTDPRNLKVLPDEAVGGLTGRLIWVIESTRRKDNTGWKVDDKRAIKQKLLRECLIHDLQRIAQLQGEMSAEPEARSMYDDWYKKLSQKDTKNPTADAFYQRCHATALRVGSLLSVSAGDDLLITKGQMQKAIELIEAQLPENERISMWSGASVYEQSRAKYISFLQRLGGISTRRATLKHMGVNEEEFNKITGTLVSDGTLEQPFMSGREMVIKLTKEGMGKVVKVEEEKK